MLPSKVFLSLIFIALSAADVNPLGRRTGKPTLGITARINDRGTGLTIAEKDRARAQAFQQGAHLGKRAGTGSINVTNTAITYTADVGIGQPATSYTLLVDTGSSNTWVGAGKAYVQTSSSRNIGNTVSVNYGSGSFSGEEWNDTVTLSSALVINEQSIGVASSASGFSGIDGILGVGPVDLTANTVANTATVPTVTDNLYAQGTISENVLGVYFVPVSEANSQGELTFGGYDSSKITSAVNYIPLTTSSPASAYWGIDQSVSYGSQTILSTTAGIVDTGTTLILLATNAFQEYQKLTGATMDPTTGLLSITSTKYSKLQSLWFKAGGMSYELTANGQTWPRSLNSNIGGSSNKIYLIVADLGSSTGGAFNFVNGFAFLQRYYSIYDTTNRQVGFASTRYTNATTN